MNHLFEAECMICPAQADGSRTLFTEYSEYIDHLKQHMRQKNIKWGKCILSGCTFNHHGHADALARHLINEYEKKYNQRLKFAFICSVCDQRLTLKKYLKAHLKTKHPKHKKTV